MELDLHIHSNVSDGALEPSAVVALAAGAQLDAIALADHDTVFGIEEAVEAASGRSIQVIPAIEVSATTGRTELHILGYFVDPSDEALLAYARDAATRREVRLREMLGRLADEGVELSFEDVQSASAGKGTLGRPHLARAMVEAGYVDRVGEAFERYIGNEHAAYIPTRLLDPAQAIRLIEAAGGLAVWAHPPSRHLRDLLPGLVASGLRGLEVFRPWTPGAWMVELERTAREWGLLVSGGSDWHGPEQGELGEFRVSASEVAALLEAGGM